MRTAAILPLILPALAAIPSPGPAQVTVVRPPVAPVVEGLVTEGRVTRVDRATRRIALDNGDEYAIPPSLDTTWAVVREGSVRRRALGDALGEHRRERGARRVLERTDVEPSYLLPHRGRHLDVEADFAAAAGSAASGAEIGVLRQAREEPATVDHASGVDARARDVAIDVRREA